jgi:hypothetical protein
MRRATVLSLPLCQCSLLKSMLDTETKAILYNRSVNEEKVETLWLKFVDTLELSSDIQIRQQHMTLSIPRNCSPFRERDQHVGRYHKYLNEQNSPSAY